MGVIKKHNIKYVDVIIDCSVVESFLKKVEHRFVFKSDYFSDCENIEEIRDKFYEGLNPDYVVDYIHIYLYKSEEDLDNEDFVEYLGE